MLSSAQALLQVNGSISLGLGCILGIALGQIAVFQGYIHEASGASVSTATRYRTSCIRLRRFSVKVS